jgi:hypothetical protein
LFYPPAHPDRWDPWLVSGLFTVLAIASALAMIW